MLVGAGGIKRALFKGRGQVLSGRFYIRFILKHYRVTLSVPIVRFRMRVGEVRMRQLTRMERSMRERVQVCRAVTG